MKDVPTPLQMPEQPEPDGSRHGTRPVSALGVKLDTSSQTVMVRLRDPNNQYDFLFALSPPAAAQLSRLLKKEVKRYLRAVPEDGS